MSKKTDEIITVSLNKAQLRALFKKYLPLILIVVALLLLNWGLYKRLAPEEPFNAFIYPYEEDFQEAEVHRWFKPEGGGSWTLEDEALIQNNIEAEDASVFIPRWLVEDQPYQIKAEMEITAEGQNVGINFNAQYPEIYEQHHRTIVLYENGEYALTAGVVTLDEGYKEQIRIPLEALEQPFRLDVLVGEGIYAVQVNGQTLIENRPLIYFNGLVGFIASGVAKVDDLSITEVEDVNFDVNLSEVETLPQEIAEPVVGDMIYTSNFAGGSADNGWVSFSGDWQIVDGYLTQRDPTGADYGTGYEPSVFQSYIVQVAFDHQEGIGAGVLFNMPTPYQTNGAHMVRYAETGNGVFWGYYDELGNFSGQGHAIMPTTENTPHTIKILSGEETYSVFVDNQKVAEGVPLMQNSGYIGLITSHSAAAYGLVDISGLNSNLLEADAGGTLIVGGTGTGNGTTPDVGLATPPTTTDGVDWTAPLHANPGLYTSGFHPTAAAEAWLPINGHWRVKDDLLAQTDQGGYDFGIGYSGATFQNYRYDVAVTHTAGQGGGLLFNMPEPDNLAWASIVRYSDAEDKLMWGYYDEESKFKGQGSVEVDSPGVDAHIISVQTKENTYDVYLDDELVGQDIPMARKSGHIGLVTARSAARFSGLVISSGNENVETLGNMRVVSGNWTQEEGLITQTNIEPGDYILSTDVLAGIYTLETTITLPSDAELADAGGGVIFHMPNQDSRTNAHLVRLAGGGTGVFWGYFDQENAFVGQGSASFADHEGLGTSEGDYAVRIVVEQDHYALFINDVEIAGNVALTNTEGYIGLLAYRGPVQFGQIDLTVGGAE